MSALSHDETESRSPKLPVMAKKRSADLGTEQLPAKKVHKERQTSQSSHKPSQSHSREHWQAHFRDGLFSGTYVSDKKKDYSRSSPYKHAVIEGFIDDSLLRGVRKEVLSEIHYTQKETDIYKIHQSGDLANLDGLDDTSLAKLPNLLKLRNALYSPVFREFLETVTGSGKLSGEKTDMAINIYTPGSHLLCHDDVIGSRRISYILYLTDPEDPWQEEWGGALRLYPTREFRNSAGEVSHVPQPDYTKIIYPAWNQLSFFAVQPGQSFHDVGEVYENKGAPKHRQPMRVAISGWFHIPQQGESGFIEGEAEALQKESSLTTLQSSDKQFDYPRPRPTLYPEYDPASLRPFQPRKQRNSKQVEEDKVEEVESKKRKALFNAYQKGEEDPEHDVLTEEEAGFLCKYINPMFLAPDQAEEMHESFNENGQIVIEKFLHPKFARAIEHYVEQHFPQNLSASTKAIERELCWTVAKPPHKHKYLVMDQSSGDPDAATRRLIGNNVPPQNQLKHLLDNVFNSLAFRKWLQIITGLIFKSHDARIRRFRRGQDYQLAKLYKEKEGRVELTLGLTTAGKWESPAEDDPEPAEDDVAEDGPVEKKRKLEGPEDSRAASTSRTANGNRHVTPKPLFKAPEIVTFEPLSTDEPSDETNNGGYEMFIRGDEDEDEDLPDADDASGKKQSGKSNGHSHLDVTGKQNRKKADPAVYQAVGDDDEDDGILLNMAAGFNRLSIVLRDSGTMRFVKYVSERAGADRWDLTGEWEVDWQRSAKVHGWDEEGSDEDGNEENENEDEDEDGDEDENGDDDGLLDDA